MHRAILSNSKEIFSNKNIIRTSVDDCYPVAVFGLLVFCSTVRTFVGQYNDVFCGFWMLLGYWTYVHVQLTPKTQKFHRFTAILRQFQISPSFDWDWWDRASVVYIRFTIKLEISTLEALVQMCSLGNNDMVS